MPTIGATVSAAAEPTGVATAVWARAQHATRPNTVAMHALVTTPVMMVWVSESESESGSR